MLASWRKSALLTANDTTFALTMAVVVFVAVICEMTFPVPYHHGISADLPIVNWPVSMPHAMREDAITIIVTRSGDVFFGRDLVSLERMPELIRERLARGSERKVYIRADVRTYYGNVKEVIDAVHAAALGEVTFLAEQRHPKGTAARSDLGGGSQ